MHTRTIKGTPTTTPPAPPTITPPAPPTITPPVNVTVVVTDQDKNLYDSINLGDAQLAQDHDHLDKLCNPSYTSHEDLTSYGTDTASTNDDTVSLTNDPINDTVSLQNPNDDPLYI